MEFLSIQGIFSCSWWVFFPKAFQLGWMVMHALNIWPKCNCLSANVLNGRRTCCGTVS